MLKYKLAWTTEPWKPSKQTLVVPKSGLVLFDAIAQHPQAPQNAERGQTWLPLELTPGTYVLETAQQAFDRRAAVSLLYLHPQGHRPELGGEAAPAAPAALVIDKATAAAAKKLKFVESEGGPLVFMPERVAAKWWGICNEQGDEVYDDEPTHYERACKVRGEVGVLEVGDGDALVLGTPQSTAAHLLEHGLLLLRWVGADHAAAVLAPALGPGVYKATKLVITSRGEPWLLFDSAEDGRKLAKKNIARVTVPKGRYRIELMKEWNGEVSLNGATSEVMTAAVRLARV